MSWRCSPRTRIPPPWRKDCGSAFSRGSGSPPPSGSPPTCSRRSRSPPGCSTRATSCRISSSWACCCRCGAEQVAHTPGYTPPASRTALVARASALVGVRHRASQFLGVRAVGADARSRILYSRVKGEAEEAVRRLQLEGMQIFRPSLLVGARAQSRPAERVAGLLSMLVAWAFVGPLARYRPIKAETVARAMVRVAREAPRGTHVYESEDIRRRAAKP